MHLFCCLRFSIQLPSHSPPARSPFLQSESGDRTSLALMIAPVASNLTAAARSVKNASLGYFFGKATFQLFESGEILLESRGGVDLRAVVENSDRPRVAAVADRLH